MNYFFLNWIYLCLFIGIYSLLMSMLKGIVAMDENRIIGNKGGLPWSNKEDLKRFKELTQNQICILGRATYNGLKKYYPGKEGYPYAKEQIIFGRDTNIDELLDYTRDKIVWVLGGAKTFEVLMPYIDELYVTLILGKHEGDTVMPLFEDQFGKVNEEQGETCRFFVYRR